VGGIDILAFTWTLGQKGMSRARSVSEPMPSPIMAGGLFSIDRLLFYDLGTYDQGMRLYGGEEMEISFRIWQCGLTLECIPCSHVSCGCLQRQQLVVVVVVVVVAVVWGPRQT
jgi:polypeptide N-acetylgalactosaminyltransferase